MKKPPKKQSKPWNPYDLNGDGKTSMSEYLLMYQSYLHATQKSNEDSDYEDYSAFDDYLDTSWRSNYYTDIVKYNINPNDFSLEADYLAARKAVDEAWKNAFEEEAEKYDLITDFYADKEDFLDALNDAKYGWRDYYCEEHASTGLDPYDYETEAEYLAALNSFQGITIQIGTEVGDNIDDTEYVDIWNEIDAIEDLVRSENIEEAQSRFDTVLFGDKFDVEDKDTLVLKLIYRFYDADNVDYLETYRDTLFQSIYKITDPELLKKAEKWQEELFDYIDTILSASENYAFSRYYEWRNKYTEYIKSKWYTDPCDFQTEDEFLAALDEEQNGWKRHFTDDCKKYGLSVDDFEDEYDCRDAIDAARQEKREKEWQAVEEKWAAKRKIYAEEYYKISEENCAAVEDDGTVYTFCQVKIPFKNMKPLSYLTNGVELSVHDDVLVPFGKDDTPTSAVVVSVIQCTSSTAPYPPEKTKTIIEKISPKE